MANALVGKTSVTISWLVPDVGVETFREMLQGHMEFMKAKSHSEGPLELIHYSISEGPEYKEWGSFAKGELPDKTGRTVFTLFEIYAEEDGLKHHWIESAEFLPAMAEAVELFNVELFIFSHTKITQSLWD
tara:strand:+ start:129 stop:521 length:393 start_codon:yes stop_codon:yes gene_type:complete